MEVNSENLQKDQRQNGGDETYDKHRLELNTTKHRHPHITNEWFNQNILSNHPVSDVIKIHCFTCFIIFNCDIYSFSVFAVKRDIRLTASFPGQPG